MFKNVIISSKKNARQAPAGTAESKKRIMKKKRCSITNGKQTNATSFPNVDFLMMKGKQFVAIYFPNVVCWTIKGKHLFAIYFPDVD